jgi:predicted GNAT family acetyltransferase
MSIINNENHLKNQIEFMKSSLNEKQYRLFLGATAISIGRGGQALIARLSGASVNTVRRGIQEVKAGEGYTIRVRKSGGGRKSSSEKYPDIQKAIEEIIDGKICGDPERIIHWTTMSLMDIAEKLKSDYDIQVSHTVVSSELTKMGYSKQLNQKMLQVGTPHPDRNEQFEFINSMSEDFIANGIPVISIDCKKKENLGNFKNNGSEYRRKGDARKVLDHDFLIKELGTVAPYGIYDVDKNTGFINLGISHDTAEFAVNSIYQWWLHIGKDTYPDAKRIYINCDGGGSNGSRLHLWKLQLAKFSEITGLEVVVSHFPPGTSKWNKIEHRLFCYVSKKWAGQPLIDIETVIDLIGSTTTTQGLKVKCVLDKNEYKTGIKVSNEDYDRINIQHIGNLPDWNYIIRGFSHS